MAKKTTRNTQEENGQSPDDLSELLSGINTDSLETFPQKPPEQAEQSPIRSLIAQNEDVAERNRRPTKLQEQDNEFPKGLAGNKGYILYFWSRFGANCSLKILTNVQSYIENNNTLESFHLGAPCFFLNGVPVFAVVRNEPCSLTFRMLQECFVEEGYSASEIYSKVKSAFVKRMWDHQGYEPKNWLITGMAAALSVLTTYLVCSLTMIPAPVMPTP